MTQSSKHILSARVLQWIVDSVDTKARIESIERLHGGISSIVHRVSLQSGDHISDFVVRQFNNKEWLMNEPDLAVHEASNLRLVRKAYVPTPEIVAFDETGEHCGMPTVLMTKLEGSVILNPIDMNAWLDGLAQSLVSIHKATLDEYPWSYRTYMDLNTLEVPTWSNYQQSWSRAIDIAKGSKPLVNMCFIHRDYHPANVLWHQGKVSGVVDWVNACRGPVGADLGHCRLNLAMLFNVDTANMFLSKYESHAGEAFKYDPYWDLLSLMDTLFGPPTVYQGWTDLGVTGLTDELMCQRSDAYLLSLLERSNRV